MERSRGIRGFVQNMLFPDMEGLVELLEQLDRRANLVDASVSQLDKTVDQVDKGMVQLDHGLNQIDKEMISLGKGLAQVNRGMDQLNKDVDERERDLGMRLVTLKAKLEDDHARAMGEILSLLDVHAMAEPEVTVRNRVDPRPRSPEEGQVPSYDAPQPTPQQAVHQAPQHAGQQALYQPPPQTAEEVNAFSDVPAGNARAMSELSSLLGLSKRSDTLRDDSDIGNMKANGHVPSQDFASILEHIRSLQTGA